MDIQAYFDRIGFTDGGTDTERLFRLHRCHLLTIPFEALDVYNGKTVSLDPEDLPDDFLENLESVKPEIDGFHFDEEEGSGSSAEK